MFVSNIKLLYRYIRKFEYDGETQRICIYKLLVIVQSIGIYHLYKLPSLIHLKYKFNPQNRSKKI